jgi:hypothetical protein
MHGLRVRSDFLLPLSPLTVEHRAEPDVEFRLAGAERAVPETDGVLRVSIPCPVHGEDLTVRRGRAGTHIWVHETGTFHVHPGERRVDVYPEQAASDHVIGLVLAGHISVYVLNRLSFPTLHASAVVDGRGALAFLGPKGRGKSTMAASFLRLGAELLTDDILPLEAREDGVYAVPSLPLMKLWPGSIDGTLGRPELKDHLPDVLPGVDKKLLTIEGHFDFAQRPAPVRGLYLLERPSAVGPGRNDVRIERLSAREGLAALLRHISTTAFLLPVEVGHLLPVFSRLVMQAPVRRLTYPSGFEHQEAVCARVLADLEGGTSP